MRSKDSSAFFKNLVLIPSYQAFPGSFFVDDFQLSKNPIMAKAWKERLEPNLKKYKKEIGYGNLLFSEQFGFLIY